LTFSTNVNVISSVLTEVRAHVLFAQLTQLIFNFFFRNQKIFFDDVYEI